MSTPTTLFPVAATVKVGDIVWANKNGHVFRGRVVKIVAGSPVNLAELGPVPNAPGPPGTFDPKDVSQAAMACFFAAERCESPEWVGPNARQRLLGPTIFLLALAAELYLKTIFILEKGKHTRGHNLVALFKKASPESKKAVIARLGKWEPQFQPMLSKHANTFEDWRYAYENESPDAEIEFLRAFATACRAVAEGLLSARP
jgi:HEPN domain-containing protein